MDKRVVNMERQRSRYYRAATAIMRKALKKYNDDFIAQIKKCNSYQQMMDVAEHAIKSEEIENALKQIYVPVSKHFGQQTYEELKKQAGLKRRPPNVEQDYWFAWVDKVFRTQLGTRITWITGTTKDEFINVVQKIASKGFAEGQSVQDMAKLMQYELNITKDYRAIRIARTEVISASNMSSQAGAVATGIAMDKVWIAYIDDKTRESHIAINGEVVDMNDEFSNGLTVPGDPSGDAEEVINCRCAVGYQAKSDSEFDWGRNV